MSNGHVITHSARLQDIASAARLQRDCESTDLARVYRWTRGRVTAGPMSAGTSLPSSRMGNAREPDGEKCTR